MHHSSSTFLKFVCSSIQPKVVDHFWGKFSPRNPKTTPWIWRQPVGGSRNSWCFNITKPFESSQVETTSFNTRKSLIDGNLRLDLPNILLFSLGTPSTNLSSWRVRVFFLGFQTLEKKTCQTASIYFFGVCVRHYQWRVDSSCGFLVPTLAAFDVMAAHAVKPSNKGESSEKMIFLVWASISGFRPIPYPIYSKTFT